ncbi:ATP-binding protein [Neobacillus cucumis]|uniref:ATP-binding protein n=1 Tax=Neobacillus cucumis TaxID=1740721 RepID=UPI0023BB1728|nr:ATP-binding protein [Neobacillus cucumis]
MTCRFILNGENILLPGPSTHLAIDLTIKAIEKGNTAYYTRCDDFILYCKMQNSEKLLAVGK